jgi:hypothetical protein
MRNERASQPGAARPKYRCLADSTIDEASLLAACRSMARRHRRCADAAIDGLVHDRWLMRRLPAMPRTAGFEAPRSRGYGYTSLPEPSYMFTLVDRGADLLLKGGRIGSEMADALKAEARRRAEVDGFYGLIVFASAVARRPV